MSSVADDTAWGGQGFQVAPEVGRSQAWFMAFRPALHGLQVALYSSGREMRPAPFQTTGCSRRRP